MTTVYFATNRNPIPDKDQPTDFGTQFSPSGLDDLRFGIAQIKDDGTITLKVLPDNPKQGSQALFKTIKKQMGPGSDTIVFIHGYNVTFNQALQAGAKMAVKYAITHEAQPYQPNIFVFSWPSDGQAIPPMTYSHDRRDAKASGLPVARGLLKLAEFIQNIAPGDECKGKLQLITHSMGAYVLRNALQEMRNLTGDKLGRLFDQIILAAADEDDDAFEFDYKLSLLPQICQRITVYFNSYDSALIISDKTKNNPERLGHDGPRHPHQLSSKVVVVDVTDFTPAGLTGHAYYLENDRVIADIRPVFLGVASESIKGRIYVPHANKFRLV